MNDLVAGVALVGLLSALLFVASMRISRALSPRLNNLISIFLITLMVAFVLLVQGRVILSRILPFSNLIIIGNFQPLIVSMFAGFAWGRLPAAMWRRSLVIASLVIACLFGMYEPILGNTPKLDDRWADGVCLQTSPASCTPAAAATMLNAYDILASEQELAMLCLTTTQGTSVHGLYRGLKLKTAKTPWDVYLFDDATIDELQRLGGPLLISVELKPEDRFDPRVGNTFGWMPGVPHTVVLLGFSHGGTMVRIADPAIGHELWTLDDLKLLWHGQGASLVRAKSDGTEK